MTDPGRHTPVDSRPLGVVSSAHFMVDAFSNMYAPLLPLLMPRLGMSLQAAGTLMMVFQAAASLSQLAFGRLADRGHARALLVAGPLLSATVLSLMGLVHHQAMLALATVMRTSVDASRAMPMGPRRRRSNTSSRLALRSEASAVPRLSPTNPKERASTTLRSAFVNTDVTLTMTGVRLSRSA